MKTRFTNDPEDPEISPSEIARLEFECIYGTIESMTAMGFDFDVIKVELDKKLKREAQ